MNNELPPDAKVSDTPLTDAFYRKHPITEYETVADPDDCNAWIEFARSLERRLRQDMQGSPAQAGEMPENIHEAAGQRLRGKADPMHVSIAEPSTVRQVMDNREVPMALMGGEVSEIADYIAELRSLCATLREQVEALWKRNLQKEDEITEQWMPLRERLQSAEQSAQKMAGALREIRDLVYRQSLPITSKVHDIADAALQSGKGE